MLMVRKFLACVLALCLAGAALAQQRMVVIPEAAKRADMSFNGSLDVLINGRQARMAPGARIFDRNNYLQMYGSVNGTFRVKYLLEQLSGLVQTVWILTDEEIARPDPAPAQ